MHDVTSFMWQEVAIWHPSCTIGFTNVEPIETASNTVEVMAVFVIKHCCSLLYVISARNAGDHVAVRRPAARGGSPTQRHRFLSKLEGSL